MVRGDRWNALGAAVLVLLMVMAAMPVGVHGAGGFASPAFEAQWNSVEGTIPNFWGPLDTAREGQAEPYAEGMYNGQSGQRLVQYFDKGRMELTDPGSGTVTNGLLTVDLKRAQVQRGDTAFEGLNSAQIGIAGDEGSPGPTYATLYQLMEREAQASGAVSLTYDGATGTLGTFTRGAASTDPQAAFTTYLGDPNGRFGQNVPKAFADFLEGIPGGYLSTMGYPITPAFQTTVTLRGQAGVAVIIQAFERRVLTYTPANAPAFQVEFGNIGRHYYQWRYGPPPLVAPGRLPESFRGLYNRDEQVRVRLGPPDAAGSQRPGAWLPFERGYVIYSGDPDAGRGRMYPLYGDLQRGETGGYSMGIGFGSEADPTRPGGGPGPQPGLYEPKGSFFVFWSLFAGRERLGYATTAEATRFPLTGQGFQRGVMLSTPDGQGVYVLWRDREKGDRYERFAAPSR